MAQKSLFFNAFPDSSSPTGYDRNYNADDISDWFSIVCATGVLKGGLQVSVGTGLSVNVSIGKATIQGKGYVNNAVVNLSVGNAPTGSSPYYVPIKLQENNEQEINGRFIELVVGDPLTSVPTISDLSQTEQLYELMLGYAVIQPNASSVSQVVDTRGQDVCPWFTAVKGYDDYYDAIVQQFEYNTTLATTSTTVVTNLAANLYNNNYSLVEVYVNGLREEETNYTVATNSSYITITFTSAKNAGADVSVILNNFLDGEGLPNVLSEYNQWVQDVANLKAANNYTYVCNGLTDNQQITNIVNQFIDAGTDYSSLNLKIVGTFGCYNGTQYPVPVGGSGTSASPYRMFDFHAGNRRVTLDFTNCSQISISISGVYAYIFYATNITIKGLNLVSSGTTSGTSIKAFNSGANVVCENSRFWINGYLDSLIAYEGTFTNCRGSVSNVTGNSYCFLSNDILRLNGGEYISYTGASSSKSAIVGQSAANSVSILYGVNAPTISRSGFYQTNAIYQVNTNNYVNCSDLISALPLSVQSGYSNIRGTIPLSKN